MTKIADRFYKTKTLAHGKDSHHCPELDAAGKVCNEDKMNNWVRQRDRNIWRCHKEALIGNPPSITLYRHEPGTEIEVYLVEKSLIDAFLAEWEKYE